MQQIQIQDQSLTVKEYKDKRVVTFRDIDTVHQRPEGTASRNFRENRDRFVNGVDFFNITPHDFQLDEIRRFGILSPKGGFLITETGYLMLVKSFTDDLAWKVQRELVDTYFRVKEQTVTEAPPIESPGYGVFLEAARIMATIPDSQQYVINCLRHVVPDIDAIKISPYISGTISPLDKKRFIKEGVDIDTSKLLSEIGNQGLSISVVAKRANVSVASVMNWISGKHRPVLQNRTNMCRALGQDENFLTPRRTRNTKK